LNPKDRSAAWLPALSASMACIFGGSALVTMRYGIAQSDIFAVALWRQLGPVIVLGSAALALRRRAVRMPPRDLAAILVLALSQYGGVNYLMTASVAYITAARAALIMGVMPLAALALGALLGRERFTAAKLVGAIVALVGVAVALGDQAAEVGADAWKGDLLMLGGTIGGGLNSVLLAPYPQRYGAVPVGGIASVIGAAVCLVAVLLFGSLGATVGYDAIGWVATAWTALGGGAASLYLWIWALRHATPTRVTVAVSFNPIAAMALGALALGEAITPRLLAGLVGVVAGIVIAYWPARLPVTGPRIDRQPAS
jgi:drug/metabolite transporter (DMT)-like permease